MSLLFNFRPLVINPELAVRIGLNEAIVLQQVNYWINDKEQGVNHDGRRWVFNSYDAWVKQFPFWSADTVKRAFTSLVKQGCLDVEQLNKSQHDRTNYYTINQQCPLLTEGEHLPRSMGADCPDREMQSALMDEGKNARSLTVTTTKTTTETNSNGAQAEARTPTKRSSQEYSPEFETAWQTYPKRSGGNPKATAWKHWSARIREGVTPETLLAGVQRYAVYIQATGKVGTEFVKQTCTFFGPDRHFDEPWHAPTGPQRQTASQQKHSDFSSRDYGQTQNPAWARSNH